MLRLANSRNLMILLLLNLSYVAVSEAHTDLTQVARYSSISNKPTLGQRNLLEQTIHIRFSQKIQTIGQAIEHVLHPTGYSLIPTHALHPQVQSLLSQPLPLVDQELGPMRLNEALRVIVGPAFDVLHDPLHRLISFKVRSEYLQSEDENE